MININVTVSNKKQLKKLVQMVESMAYLSKDTNLKKYLKAKVMEIAQKRTDELLTGGTTNDEAISLYKSSHKTVDTENGFILYNDAKIPANTTTPENYPNGEFNIALAFEYGVGIIGEGTYNGDVFTSWEYNVNNYNFGWLYRKDGITQHTYGYMGFEIYRNIAIEINANLEKWVKNYIKKNGGVRK